MKPFRLIKSSLAAGAILIATSGLTDAANPQDDFDRLSADLEEFHQLELLRGGSGEPVVFDSEAARAHGFSADAIKLGQQIADQTNDIVNQITEAKELDWRHAVSLDMSERPELQSFLAEASKRSQVQTNAQESEAAPQTPGARLVCGYYPNPKPARAVPFRDYWFSDPESQARRLGYHPTPGVMGGGWTRPQTYQPLFCWFNKFRDHVIINYPHLFREQDYTGSPGGEPNPELIPPWPYADWPLYVYWWHRTF